MKRLVYACILFMLMISAACSKEAPGEGEATAAIAVAAATTRSASTVGSNEVVKTGVATRSPAQDTSHPETTLSPSQSPGLPTSAPKPNETTFDENHNCTVAGPLEVPTGDYLISLNDLTELKVDVAVTHLIDGHTFQDLLNLQSEPGEPFVKVYWMSQPFYFTKDHKVWTYSFDEVGEHVILILQHVFEGIWICDPFMVIEAPTKE